MKKFGLIGKTLGHSYSKSFFTDFFEKNDIDAEYKNIEVPVIENVLEVIKSDWTGLNVTYPYKELVIPYIDELDSISREIGAVNVIAFKNGKSIGFNSDAYGFHQSIKPFLTNKHERVLIFGTGGVSKAVEYVLKKIGLDVFYISRSPNRDNQFGYDDINEYMLNSCKLLVNCTPVGTYPAVEDELPIPYQYIGADHLVVDLVYNPVKTKFLERAELAGATILNGETMLKQQALRAWQIWMNV